MTPASDASIAELLLRGAVGGVLLFHVVHLLLPGPRAAVRGALALFTISLIAYLFCQRAELMVVLQGEGDILTGGKLVDEKRVNANNLTGSSIEGGTSHKVVKGDMILIPAYSPHQVTPSGGAPIVLMTMHVPYPPAGWPPAN